VATTDPRRRPATGTPPRPWARGRTFPPAVEYAALEGLPGPVRFTVATAVLPLEVVVSSVRLLRNVEQLVGEVAVQLRLLRPAVAAAGEAYADGRFDPLVETVADVRHGSDAIAIVRAPWTTVREVVLGHPAPGPVPPEATAVVALDETPPPPTVTGWLGGLGGAVGRRLGVVRPPDPEP
jgi:hypothetical protein